MRPGRKPAGSKLVDGLRGSDFAKKRLQQILQTLAGEATVEEACAELKISRARFYDLRQELLEDMVERLEPRPAGRPRQALEVPDEVSHLEEKVERLKLELEASKVRAELNTFLPLYRPKKNDR